MCINEKIVAELTTFGVTDIAFYPVPETTVTAVRITDDPYQNHGVAQLLGEIIQTIAPVMSVASNALYADDDKIGAVVFIHAEV